MFSVVENGQSSTTASLCMNTTNSFGHHLSWWSIRRRNAEAQTFICSVNYNLTLKQSQKRRRIQFSLTSSAFLFVDDSKRIRMKLTCRDVKARAFQRKTSLFNITRFQSKPHRNCKIALFKR